MEKRKSLAARIIGLLLTAVMILSGMAVPVQAERDAAAIIMYEETERETISDEEADKTEMVLKEEITEEEEQQAADVDEGERVGSVSVSITHGTQSMLGEKEIPLYQTDTMMDAIERACQMNGIPIRFSDEKKTYITSIGGVEEMDEGPMSGWMGTLNDWFTDHGFRDYSVPNGMLRNGDCITVLYTRSYGMDLTDMMDGTGNLKELSVTDGRLQQTFSGDNYEYTLVREAQAETIKLSTEAINRHYKVTISADGRIYRNNEQIPVTAGTRIEITTEKGSGQIIEGELSEGKTYILTVSDIETEEPEKPHVHSWSEWEIIKQPTAVTAGIKSRSCSGCGATEALDIPKLKATIKVNTSSILLRIGQTSSNLRVTGMAAGDRVKQYRSSNTRIFTVTKKGKLTAGKKAGKATLTIMLTSGLKKNIPVKVQTGVVKTTKLSGIPATLALKKGKTEALKPVRMPITSQQGVTYTSSNKKIVVVDKSGKVKGIKKGKAVITVKSGTVVKKCTVTVK